MHQIYRPRRAFRCTGAASFALDDIYLRLSPDIDDRHIVGAYPHTGKTGGALLTVTTATIPPTERFSFARMVQALATAAPA